MKKIIIGLIVGLIGIIGPISMISAQTEIIDGDLIRAQSDIDVYIIKIVDPSSSSGQVKQFKRLILNPEIFNQYGHLKWENIKTVSQTELDGYVVSDLVRAKGDEKVYKLYPDGDVGTKRWIKTADDFAGFEYDADAIYTINDFERDFYNSDEDLIYSEEPAIQPEPETPSRNPITINVPADYSALQSAIDAAISGDTISVAKGTYKENIIINKNIKLVGASSGSVIIDGQGTDSAIIVNGADDFLIQKFTIKSQNQKAIHCSGTNKTKGTIKNIILKDSQWGIYAENNCELTLLNNIIYNNRASDNKDGGGIFIKDNLSHNITTEIRNNTIDDNHHGIWIESSKVKSINNIITSNMGSGASVGVYLKNGEINNTYSDIWGNGTNSVGGVGIGDGGISLDSRFVNTKERNYHLIWGSGDVSPCIDAGSPNTIYNDGKLFTGTNYRGDIGAYGGPDNIGWDL